MNSHLLRTDYPPIIIHSVGHIGGAISLLATGVVGVILSMFVDKIARISWQSDWKALSAAGWMAVVMFWLCIINFTYSWGPASWILIDGIFPLSIRAKGTSYRYLLNWMK